MPQILMQASPPAIPIAPPAVQGEAANLLLWIAILLGLVIAEGVRRIIRAALAYREELRAVHQADIAEAKALAAATATIDAQKTTIEQQRARIVELERRSVP